MIRVAVYPGTFDPLTNGHVDIIKRGRKIFDKVIIAIADNPKKKPLFKLTERIEMIQETVKGFDGVEVEAFTGLLVEYIKQRKATAIIRGLRAVGDFEYEFRMALINRRLEPAIETVFLMPSEENSYLTSSTVREVADYGGDLSGLVPEPVSLRFKEKMRRRTP